MTSPAHIALTRFGYGLRRGESVPGNAQRFLLDQLDAYDPRPAALEGREDTSRKAGEILELLRIERLKRRADREGTAASLGQVRKAMEQAEKANASGNSLLGLPEELRQNYLNGVKIAQADAGFKIGMAVTSPAPFVERLVHFWSNHFSVTMRKPGTGQQVGNLEFGAIRPRVLGKFSDLLKASVLHPAMLMYLDQFQSIGPNSPARRRFRRRGLNENLAREIMELHTLGVNGGYSQEDVTEFARALTGWTLSGFARFDAFSTPQPSGAAFLAAAHEPGTRTVLGKTYREGGAEQAIAILDDLAAHPATARFIAGKLARHFAGDDAPESLTARLEKDFLSSGGDLASLARTLVEATECWVEGPVKYRQPAEWLIASLRLVGAGPPEGRIAMNMLNQMGQAPWGAPSPAGYDDKDASWAGPDALYRRVDIAERIARRVPAENVLEQAEQAFPGALSDHTRLWLGRAASERQALGLLLVAPEMMRR